MRTERKSGFSYSELVPELSRCQTSRPRCDCGARTEADTVELYNMHVRAVELHRSGEYALARDLYESILFKYRLAGMRKLRFLVLNNLALLHEDTADFVQVSVYLFAATHDSVAVQPVTLACALSRRRRRIKEPSSSVPADLSSPSVPTARNPIRGHNDKLWPISHRAACPLTSIELACPKTNVSARGYYYAWPLGQI